MLRLASGSNAAGALIARLGGLQFLSAALDLSYRPTSSLSRTDEIAVCIQTSIGLFDDGALVVRREATPLGFGWHLGIMD